MLGLEDAGQMYRVRLQQKKHSKPCQNLLEIKHLLIFSLTGTVRCCVASPSSLALVAVGLSHIASREGRGLGDILRGGRGLGDILKGGIVSLFKLVTLGYFVYVLLAVLLF